MEKSKIMLEKESLEIFKRRGRSEGRLEGIKETIIERLTEKMRKNHKKLTLSRYCVILRKRRRKWYVSSIFC